MLLRRVIGQIKGKTWVRARLDFSIFVKGTPR
jgi:hypothetical protein